MATTADEVRNKPTPLWLTEMQDRLLLNAELVVLSDYCQNHCVHHKPITPCHECPRFEVQTGGYICCEGYEQEVTA